METTTNQYDTQAAEFLAKTGAKIETQYVGHDSRMGSNVPTAHFKVTISREGRKPWTFDYSDSQADSYVWQDTRSGRIMEKWGPAPYGIWGKVEAGTRKTPDVAMREAAWGDKPVEWAGYRIRKAVPKPSDYAILACLTKSDPGPFSEFCAEYGYSDDSIKAREIWQAVCEEWANVRRMFAPKEIEALGEIQ